MFNYKSIDFTLLVSVILLCAPVYAQAQFTFTVTSDQREYSGSDTYNNSNYFKGVVEAIQKQSSGAFMVSPGDIDPPRRPQCGQWSGSPHGGQFRGDTGAPSTLLMVHVNDSTVTFNSYRDTHDGVYDYEDIIHSGTIKDSSASISIFFQDGVSPEVRVFWDP